MTQPEIIKRIGYCCKTVLDDRALTEVFNFKSTTLSYMNKLDTESRFDKISGIISHNMNALAHVLMYLAEKPVAKRMFRIGSELLPMFDHPIAAGIYASTEIQENIRDSLASIGEIVEQYNIRLSFHPDQFVVIASPNPDVATRGIATLEKFGEIASMMGYQGWHPRGFTVNIHGGAACVTNSQLRDAIVNRLSDRMRGFVSLENDEFSHNLSNLCELKDVVAIVPDIHHYWISEFSQLNNSNSLLNDVVESWRGSRPKLHLAMSREHLIPDQLKNNSNLCLNTLIEQHNLTKTKLRAHSDSPWHTGTLDSVKTMWDRFDIVWEGKDKNLGQAVIYDHFNRGIIISS